MHSQQKKSRRFPWWILYAILALIIGILYVMGGFDTPRIISSKDFETNLLQRNAIEKIVVVDNARAEIYLKSGLSADPDFKAVFKHAIGKKLNAGPHYWLNISSGDSFEKKLAALQKTGSTDIIPVKYRSDKMDLRELVTWTIAAVLLLSATLLLKNRQKRSFGKLPEVHHI